MTHEHDCPAMAMAHGRRQARQENPCDGQYPPKESSQEAESHCHDVSLLTTDAIVTEGSEVGTIHKVCTSPACPVHHPKKAHGNGTNDAAFKSEQEKRRREEASANTTGLRVLSAISAAVPVRLMKRDLLFVAERLANLLVENLAIHFVAKK